MFALHLRLTIAISTAWMVCDTTHAQHTKVGSVSVKFEVPVDIDPKVKSQEFQFNDDRQLCDCLIWLKPISGESLPVTDLEREWHLDYKDGSLQPRITIAAKGDVIVIQNKSHATEMFTVPATEINGVRIGANGRFMFRVDRYTDLPEQIYIGTPGKKLVFTGALFIPIGGKATTSDSEGIAMVSELPVGEYYIKFWHQKAGMIYPAKLGDRKFTSRKETRKISVVEGDNHLGVVMVTVKP